jgi:uncharacterized protein (UPF0335 family)
MPSPKGKAGDAGPPPNRGSGGQKPKQEPVRVEVSISPELAAKALKSAGESVAPSLPIDAPEKADKATAARLKSIIERVERLEEERQGLNEDIKEVFGEAKATGFDVKIIRQIIRLRKIDLDKRREAEMLLETYKAAINME